jgi:hypothetical protein
MVVLALRCRLVDQINLLLQTTTKIILRDFFAELTLRVTVSSFANAYPVLQIKCRVNQ